MFPRDGAGSFQVEGGTGNITAIVSLVDFLEIYKSDRTFRVQSPESIDPERSNPNAPWTTTPIAEVGSSNPIVARLLLQSERILKGNMFASQEVTQTVLLHMHALKETMLTCDKLSRKMIENIDETIFRLQREGLARSNQGRMISAMPQIADLEADCGSFLVHAKRAVRLISELPYLFLTYNKKHSNFTHLSVELSELLGADAPLAKYVTDHARQMKHLIELRNSHEHPGREKTVIRDFHFLPDGQLRGPTWQIVGAEDAEERSIRDDLQWSMELLINSGEAVFLHLIDIRIPTVKPLDAAIVKIPDENLDPNFAIKFRVDYDMPSSLLTENTGPINA